MLRLILSLAILLIISSFTSLKDAKFFYESGMKHLDSRNFVGAISDFTHAISIDPKYKEAYYQRANAKLLLGEELRVAIKDIFNDLLKAKELGECDAVKLLLKKAQTECYTVNAKLSSQDEVFCLDYENANLTQMPKHTYRLSSLLSLHLSYNKIRFINTLHTLHNLLILNIDHNELTTLPSTLGQLSSLIELNASNNNINALPQEIVQLKHLKVLYLRNNQLRQLPANIDKLESLEILDLSLNKLKKIPANLFKIKKLKRIYLIGNDLKEKDVNILRQQLPNTDIYF